MKTLIFLIDTSISMGLPPGRPKFKRVVETVEAIYKHLPTGWTGYSVVFNHVETYRVTSQKLKNFKPAGGTNISNALTIALDFKPDAIILISDGDTVEPDTESKVLEMAEAYHKRGIQISTIRFIDQLSGNERLMQRISSITHGEAIQVNVNVKNDYLKAVGVFAGHGTTAKKEG